MWNAALLYTLAQQHQTDLMRETARGRKAARRHRRRQYVHANNRRDG